MVCLAPRDPGESVGPRRLSGVVVRPLNFTVRSRLAMTSDFVKGVLLVGAGMVWAVIARQLVPDTSLGVAIILVPFGVLLVLGAFLIARFRMKKLRE